MSTRDGGAFAARRTPRVLVGSIAGRLVVAFAAILLLFGLALVVVLRAMDQMDLAEREDARLDRAKHAGHVVSALVREQYIHQAHTIIEQDRSHVDHYLDVARLTERAANDLEPHARDDGERALVHEIQRLVRKNHDDFMQVTLPAVDGGDRARVVSLHADMERVVGGATRAVRDLNTLFEAGSERARTVAIGERARVRAVALSCFGAAIAIAALVAWWTTRSITRSVSALRSGAARLGDGELTRRIELDGDDELADVATAFNEMATRLVAHQAELVRSQRFAAIGRLGAAVAHEINGPIGIILGYAGLIRRDGADDEALSAIEDEARQCQRIVQTLLDTSRADDTQVAPLDLAQLARDAVDRLRAAGGLAERTVTVAGDTSVAIQGDEGKLRQVLVNLLTNAVDATTAGGHIDVRVHADGPRALLEVSDDGVGVPATLAVRDLEPFHSTKANGLGIGLAISRAIVEAHHGELHLVPGRDRGAVASIALPVVAEGAS